MPKDYHNHTFLKGVFVTPFNTIENLKLTNWHKDSAPEFLWIALIIKRYGRKIGLQYLGTICRYIKESLGEKLIDLKFSSINCLSKSAQEKIFTYILKLCDSDIFDCLCAINDPFNFVVFNTNFNCFKEYEKRLKILDDIMTEMFDFHSQLSTDISFINVWYACITGRMKICSGMSMADDLVNYVNYDIDDEEMKRIRPIIRSTFQTFNSIDNKNIYVDDFWRKYSEMKDCKCLCRKCDTLETEKTAVEKIHKVAEFLNDYLMNVNPLDNKALVLFGLFNYSKRLFDEIINMSLQNSVSSRIVFRTILENYILTKYLIKEESNHKDIWNEFQSYGFGKLKLLIERHKDLNDQSLDHIKYDYLELLMKDGYSEEFLNIDTRYFNGKNIKDKFEYVDEKELYNAYDYDSLFEHSLWGQIRESSLLKCCEPSHDYHWILDVNGDNNLPSIINDLFFVMNKHINLLNSVYEIPEEVLKNE